ncbi:MAG: hypothetical protein ABSE00_01860 [Chitinispirillaceae bacterium]
MEPSAQRGHGIFQAIGLCDATVMLQADVTVIAFAAIAGPAHGIVSGAFPATALSKMKTSQMDIRPSRSWYFPN